MTVTLNNLDEMQGFISGHSAAAIYFSGEACNVCTALFPKVEKLIGEEFPLLALGRVECNRHPDIPAQHGVFSVPTLLLFFDGNEAQRYVRTISLSALRQALQRPYHLLFDE